MIKICEIYVETDVTMHEVNHRNISNLATDCDGPKKCPIFTVNGWKGQALWALLYCSIVFLAMLSKHNRRWKQQQSVAMHLLVSQARNGRRNSMIAIGSVNPPHLEHGYPTFTFLNGIYLSTDCK